MDLSARLSQRAQQMKRYAPKKIVPTVSIRKTIAANTRLDQQAEQRLAAVCCACAATMREIPLFGSSYDGSLGLRLAQRPVIRVGLHAGQRWQTLQDADQIGPALVDKLRQTDSGVSRWGNLLGPSATLELLDLSDMGVTDWSSTLTAPLTARLVLLQPTESGMPIVMEFDNRLADAALAASFIDHIEQQLLRS